MHLVLQRLQMARCRLELRIGKYADRAAFERTDTLRMHAAVDAVHAEDVSRHRKAGDLAAAVLGDHVALEEPKPNRVDRAEYVAGLIQGLTAPDPTVSGRSLAHLVQLFGAQLGRKTMAAQVAMGALQRGPADVAQLRDPTRKFDALWRHERLER
jgi:hypothetical protein